MSSDIEREESSQRHSASATSDEPAASTGTGEAVQGHSSPDEEMLPALARQAVEAFVREHRVIKPPASPEDSLLHESAACFVSIKTATKDLRGCIGTIEPTRETLAQELISNAISAAMRDPRFYPVTEAELPNLRYSVDVLSKPEPCSFEDLDPKVFGVIVEDETGLHRGLLLPDIEGIETASQQVEIAARKAGIEPGTSLKFYRFRVHRFSERTRFKDHSAQGADR